MHFLGLARCIRAALGHPCLLVFYDQHFPDMHLRAFHMHLALVSYHVAILGSAG